MPGEVLAFGNARALTMEAAARRWNTLPTPLQELVTNIVDGHEHLEDLGAAHVNELVEAGLVESDGQGVGWTPLGYDVKGIAGGKGGPRGV